MEVSFLGLGVGPGFLSQKRRAWAERDLNQQVESTNQTKQGVSKRHESPQKFGAHQNKAIGGNTTNA